MTGALLRTGSIPLPRHNFTGSLKPTLSLPRHSQNDAVFDFHRSSNPGIRRSVSDAVILRSGSTRISAVGPFSFGTVEADDEIVTRYASSVGDLNLGNRIPVDQDGFTGGGFGNGRRYGGDRSGSGGGGRDDRIEIGEYYRRMLKDNPGDSLLLRNYGKYLHEVEKDTVGAEECYGRAILASPGDGELLSLYGHLIWRTQRDGERAQSYFDQAIRAAPDDSTVLGSYAHFLWEAEEEKEEDEQVVIKAEVAATNGAVIS